MRIRMDDWRLVNRIAGGAVPLARSSASSGGWFQLGNLTYAVGILMLGIRERKVPSG